MTHAVIAKIQQRFSFFTTMTTKEWIGIASLILWSALFFFFCRGSLRQEGFDINVARGLGVAMAIFGGLFAGLVMAISEKTDDKTGTAYVIGMIAASLVSLALAIFFSNVSPYYGLAYAAVGIGLFATIIQSLFWGHGTMRRVVWEVVFWLIGAWALAWIIQVLLWPFGRWFAHIVMAGF